MPDSPLPNLGSPIATGRTAEIFAWGDGRILKLTRADFPSILADQEWRNARIAWQAGARAPKPIEIIDVAGRRGVVFDRLDGPNMAQCMQRSLHRIRAYARQLAGLHAELHTIAAPTLPSQHQRVAWTLEHSAILPEHLKATVNQLVAKLPDNDTICHGDFHPENILLTSRGPVIIDWEGCMHGSPAADVAATCLWIRTALMLGKGLGGWVMRQIGNQLERIYLAEYSRLAPGQLEQLEAWIAVLAACRLRSDTQHHREYLLPIIEAYTSLAGAARTPCPPPPAPAQSRSTGDSR
jgi:aminoglycoside phosphotransferase (APT) family kinase protein